MAAASEAVPRTAGLRETSPRAAALDALDGTSGCHVRLWSAARAGGYLMVDRVTGARHCLTPIDDAGYAVDEAEVVFWGLRGSCQRDHEVRSR
jgi:hypothetical protein